MKDIYFVLLQSLQRVLPGEKKFSFSKNFPWVFKSPEFDAGFKE
jgi:hypothetical protein